MALHIQMSDEALEKLKKAARTSQLISFAVCAGFLLGFGGILYFTVLVIQGQVPAEFIAYTPPAEDAAPSEAPTVKELSSKVATTVPTVTPSVIVAQNAVAAVAAPVSLDTAAVEFSDTDLSVDINMDLGEGLGAGGEGLGSGKPGGSALEGTFYDLKLTRSGAPSKIATVTTENGPDGKPVKTVKIKDEQAFAREAQKFPKSWNEQALSAYYRSPQKLYASSFYVPQARDIYGPISFQCDDVCQPGGWIAVYHGKVKAWRTGKFRFVGTGDDYLGVRFNRKVVLEAGYRIPSLFDEKDPNRWWVSGMNGAHDGGKRHWKEIEEGKAKGFEGYELISFIQELAVWNSELGGLTAGKVFEVKEGHTYPIQIAISEIPGGGFGFVLFIEDVTEGKVKPGEKFDLFRTNFSMPDRNKLFEMISKAKNSKGEAVNCLFRCNSPDQLNAPPFNEDSPVWIAVP